MNVNTTAVAERLGLALRPRPEPTTEPAPAATVDTTPQRPATVADMIGQERARTQLGMALSAASARGEQAPHVLFHGPPGTGKTSLAEIVAAETGGALVRATASALGSPKNLGRTLAKLEAGDVLFIDELHGLSKLSCELLYTALEDGRIEVIVGSGTKAEVVTIELEPFTLVGATTEAGKLPRPLLDRFGAVLALTHYSTDELAEIVMRAALGRNMAITEDGCLALGRRGRGTPRVALTLLRKAHDYATVMGDGTVNEDIVTAAMAVEEIDDIGLTITDQMVLLALVDDFKGGPVGLDNLAVTAGVDLWTIKNVVEPELTRIKFLGRMPRGRVATKAAYTHLGMRAPADLGW